MKSKILLLVLFAFFGWQGGYAQCTNPPNCIQNIGTNPAVVSPYPFGQQVNSSPGTMVADWYVLSGTPVFGPGVFFMGSQTTGLQMANGDGVYTCYNFKPNKKYKICLSAVNTTSQTSGYLILEAHNGASGLIVPNTSTATFYSGNLQEYSYTLITGSTAFTQLRIYVQSSNSNYSVSVDDIGVVEAPVVTASQSTINGCGSTVLSANNSDNSLNVTWSHSGSLSSASGNTVTASPCQTTIYTATYDSRNCFDGWNCVKQEQITVSVNPGTNVTASPSTIDACGSSTLTASSTNPMTVSWNPTTYLTQTSNPNVVTVSPPQTTVYTAIFTCANGCVYNKSVTVVVQPTSLNATANPPTIDVCGSSTLTASSANPMSVTWSPATGLNPTTGYVVSASPCKTTPYTASFYCPLNKHTYTKGVTVTVQKNGSIADDSDPQCYGKIDLRYVPNTPCGGAAYKWYGPKGTLLSTGATFFKDPTQRSDEGPYMVIVTTPNGCIDTFHKLVVKDCCKPNTDFNIVDSNPVRFENTTIDGNTNLPIFQAEWYWDFGDGTSSTLRNPSHLYTTQWGPTTVCLTTVYKDGHSTCCNRICKDIDVCDFGCAAKAAFDFTIIDPVSRDIQLLDKSVGLGTACVWNWIVDGVPIPGSANPNPIVTGLLPGKHTICLDVQFRPPNGPNCIDAGWCEEIEIP